MLHIYDALLPFSWHSWTFSRIHHFAPMLTQLIGLRCSLIRQSQPSERHLDRHSFLCLRLLESPISSTVQVFYLVLCLSSYRFTHSPAPLFLPSHTVTLEIQLKGLGSVVSSTTRPRTARPQNGFLCLTPPKSEILLND